MKLYVYGSGAGTEPLPGMHHLSFSLEHNGDQYFFDAGETCGYTAHLLGVDLCKIKKVVISHTHMDHVGGLGNLLWYIRRLVVMNGRTAYDNIDIYIPNLETWEGIWKILKNTEGNFKCNFTLTPHQVTDGEIFDEDGMRVTAIHNTHLPPENGEYRSFSYLIESEGKKILYSGDYGKVDDFVSLGKNFDAIIIETGHHTSEETAIMLKTAGITTKQLCYVHNGEDVRNDPAHAIKVTEDILGCKVKVFSDGDTLEL